MLKKKIFIGLLATIFCLGLSAVAFSETGTDSNLYERTIGQSNDSISSSWSADADQMANVGAVNKATGVNKVNADRNNSRRLLCASSQGTTSEPHDGNCG